MFFHPNYHTVQLPALRIVQEKMRKKGWIESIDDDEILLDGTLVIHVFDPHDKKHWLRVSPTGFVYFAPVTFVCGGEGVF